MGLFTDEYQSFSTLNRFVIKKAVAEVNENTHLRVQPRYSYQGKSMKALKFVIESQVQSSKKSLPQQKWLRHRSCSY